MIRASSDNLRAMWRTVWIVWLTVDVTLLWTSRIDAQTSSRGAWEVEAHAGGMVPRTPLNGTGKLPPLQSLVPVQAPTPGPNVTRPVSSWYFGDGARQLNVFTTLRGRAPLVPMDVALQSAIAGHHYGSAFGVRVSRRMSTRISAELSIDTAVLAASLTDDARAALEASRASFITVLDDLFRLEPYGSRTVNSTLAISDGESRQIVTTGALRVDLVPDRRWTPYVIGGLGVNATRGEDAHAVLTGTYEVVVSSEQVVPPHMFTQTDTLTLTSHADTALVWSFGGGVRLPLSDQWGLRVDIRDYVQRNTITTRISAAPARPPSSFGTFATGAAGNPPLVFSGSPTVVSTLSVPLTNFVTFTGDGVAHRLSVTTGISWRF